MQFRRSGQRDERRRRVLIDERTAAEEDAAAPGDADAPSSTSVTPSTRYTDAASVSRQPRVTDLWPKRPWVVVALFTLAIAVLTGIETLYAHFDNWAVALGPENLRSLDVTAPASLASWFSSLLLTLGAVGCWQVYALRRHKVDDYRGSYRLWLWAAVALLLASVDATARWHLIFSGLLDHVSGDNVYGDGKLWWFAFVALVWGALGLRLAFEVARCRTATTLLGLAAIGYFVGAAFSIEVVKLPERETASIVESAAVIAGHILVLFTVVLYVRYVYLDAQGMLPAGQAKPKRRKPAKAKKKSLPVESPAEKPAEKTSEQRRAGREKRAESPQPAAPQSESKPEKHERAGLNVVAKVDDQPTSIRTPPNPKVAEPAVAGKTWRDDEDDDQSDDPRQLSKAERRRMRKLQRRDGRAAA